MEPRRRPGRAGRSAASVVLTGMFTAAAASAFLVFPGAPSASADCSGLSQSGQPASRPWAQQRLDYEQLRTLVSGAGVKVAVVDSGVDATVPQLRGRVSAGWDSLGGEATADQVGHGTFVAGIIAAAPDPATGFEGVAPGATILPIRETHTGQDGTPGGLAAGIVWAVDHGVTVVNVSVVYGNDDPSLRTAVAYAVEKDVVVVAAAGNDGSTGNAKQYPAAYPGVLSVGAIGVDGTAAAFSGTGETIGVVAPGAQITSDGAAFCGAGPIVLGAGTSFATPFVTGTVALVRAYHPTLTAAAVIHRIEATADRHAATSLPDPHYGWGVVDPVAAVTAVLPGESGLAHAAPRPAQLPVPVRPADTGASELRVAEYSATGALLLAVFVGWYGSLVRTRTTAVTSAVTSTTTGTATSAVTKP